MHYNRTDTEVKWYKENVYLKFFMNVLKKCFEAGVILSVLTIALISYFWTCTLVHTAIYNYYVPSIFHKWPVFLLSRNDIPGKFDCPSALVTLDEVSKSRNSPPELTFDLSLLERNVKIMNQECQVQGCSNVDSPNVFSRGQAYSTQFHLKVPNTPSNRELGMFKIEIALLDANLQTRYKSARAVRLPHRPILHQFFYDWFTIANIFLSDGDADNFSIEAPLIDAFVDDSMKPVHYANITVFSPRLEWSSASLHFKMKLTGIGYIITHHWFISLSLVMMACGCLFIFLTIISWQSRPRLDNFYKLIGDRVDDLATDGSAKILPRTQRKGDEIIKRAENVREKKHSKRDEKEERNSSRLHERESVSDIEDLQTSSGDSLPKDESEYNEKELIIEPKVSEMKNKKQPSSESSQEIEELPSIKQELFTETQAIIDEKSVNEELSDETKPLGGNISSLHEQTGERKEILEPKRDGSPSSSESSFTILDSSEESSMK